MWSQKYSTYISYMHIWDILHKSIKPGEGGEYSGYSAYPGHTSPS